MGKCKFRKDCPFYTEESKVCTKWGGIMMEEDQQDVIGRWRENAN